MAQCVRERRHVHRVRMPGAFARRPYRVGKVRVIHKAWDDVPVQMRGLVSERGQIDLVRLEQIVQHLFDGEHHVHEVLTGARIQLCHFFHVRLPDDATKAGIVGIANQNHATETVVPQHGFILRMAQWAGGFHSYPLTGRTLDAASLARLRASSTLSALASATPMRRRVNDSGLPNSRISDCGTRKASSTPSKAMPFSSRPP